VSAETGYGVISTRSAITDAPVELAFLVPVTRFLTVWLLLVNVELVHTSTAISSVNPTNPFVNFISIPFFL
jgi:hypothetical protein